MTELITYRINVGAPCFPTRKKAQHFLDETGLPGILKKTRGRKYLIQIGVFRTEIREDALMMQELIRELSGRNVKIIPEHNNHRKTGGKRR
jgi:hypothetical protein